jgi:SMODS-associating 2TM, beta-strand rich effector domain
VIPNHSLSILGRILAFSIALVVFASKYAMRICDVQGYFSCPTDLLSLNGMVGWIATVFTFITYLFNIWIWRTFIGRRFGWNVPDIRGTWRGDIRPIGQIGSPNIQAVLVIRQSAFRFKATLYTLESQSQSLAAEFTSIEDEAQLLYSYKNIPNLSLQQQNPEHYGTVVLDMVSSVPNTLKGFYYTQRLSRGEIELTHYCKELAQDFKDANTLSFSIRPVRR